MITAGIDIGARNLKVVVLKDGNILAKSIVSSGVELKTLVEQAFNDVLKNANISKNDIERVFSTGVGTETVPYSTDRVSTIGAIAKAGTHFFPSARTVIDIGAEETRVVKCDEKGNIIDFVTNDMCAAGAGSFIEAIARALEVKIEEMGPLSLKSETTIPMNSQCVIFAESEVVTLIHKQVSKSDIAHAVYDAMSDRIMSMVNRLGLTKDIVAIGGVARDIGFINSLKRKLNIENILVPQEPEFAIAVGSALTQVKK